MALSGAQMKIVDEFNLDILFTPISEITYRTSFLENYLIDTSHHRYVLGISGGVDSLVAGKLAQRAVENLRNLHKYSAEFIAVRLPYGEQKDESDAQAALDWIKPDQIITIDIKPAVDAMQSEISRLGIDISDFHLGNIKARQRMIAQYAIAGVMNGLVIGTDHAAEAVMGFFTKFGDGAADITPLVGLNKRRVRAIATELGAPDFLVNKTPTADLENDNPQKPDEEAYGVTYNQIDDFLEGEKIDPEAEAIIVNAYIATRHKRDLPVAP